MSEIRKVSCKATPCLAYMESEIRRLDPYTTRDAIMSCGVEHAVKEKLNWSDLHAQYKSFKENLSLADPVNTPTVFQVTLKDSVAIEALSAVETCIKEELKLTRLQSRLTYELVWYYWLLHLRKARIAVTPQSDSTDKSMTGPELIATLVEALLLNGAPERTLIEEISALVTSWKKKENFNA